jgi:prepilin-type N-terminal cleavage/methylation domain-containing protein
MLKKLQNKEQGFTIIEVMIVLVIAAVILLIVFLAVPALQRNARNTTIKNDAAAVLAAATEFQNNNNGASPTGLSQTGQDVTITGAVGSTSSTAKVSGGTTVTASTSTPTATGNISLAIGRKCSGTAISGTTTARAYAAGFLIENGSSTNPPQCVES